MQALILLTASIVELNLVKLTTFGLKSCCCCCYTSEPRDSAVTLLTAFFFLPGLTWLTCIAKPSLLNPATTFSRISKD